MRRIHELLDCWVSAAPARPAIMDFDRTVHSFSEFGAAVRDAQIRLRDAGVGPGDRVMVVGENGLALVSFIFACSQLDAWAVPVNARMTFSEIDAIRNHACPRAIVTTDGCSPIAAQHAETLDACRMAGKFGIVSVLGHLPCDREPCDDDPDDQVAATMYTTGTTGTPKGVMLTHGNFLYMSRESMKIRGITQQDTLLSVIPVTHIFGLSSAFLASLRAGALIRFLPRFDPKSVFDAFAEGVSVMPAVPQIYALLMQYAEGQGWTAAPAPKLKYISAGGAPLDNAWKRKVEAFFGITLHNGYGMTEAAPGICVTRVGMERTDTACGPPMDGVELRLVPAPGRDTLTEGVGEILCRGPNIMKGYYKNPEATEQALDRDGWLRTGDLGRMTDDGAVEVVGRSKELIIRSGFNVYPPEVEAALTNHPDVAIAAVVGNREVGGNEEVLAFIQRVPGSEVTADKLTEHLSDLIAPYKRPSKFVFTTSLPAAATGKILKHKLLETFAGELAEKS